MWSKMEIHQILPTISPGDAIGNEVLLIREILKSWGYESEIFAQSIHPSINNAKFYLEHKKRSSKNNVLIYHLSIGSDVS